VFRFFGDLDVSSAISYLLFGIEDAFNNPRGNGLILDTVFLLSANDLSVVGYSIILFIAL
jgi:hypothetical protein